MSNPHQEEAQRQLGMLEKLRERNIRERAGWGPTPLQAQQHQTGAATGLAFRIPVGKYQLGWREKLYFGESKERQERRREKLEEIDTISKAIIAHWHEFNRLHTQTYDYIDKKKRLENKLSSQKRLDDFRKQFQSWLATNQKVGMCPEQYLTRWYTNYMKDLWTYEDLRTFYSGVREMTGPRHVRPDSFGTNEKHQARDPEATQLVKHDLPGDMNDRWKHLLASDAPIRAPPMPRPDPRSAQAGWKAPPPQPAKLWPPIDFKSVPSDTTHFLNANKAVGVQHGIRDALKQKFPDYTVNQTLPYNAGGNTRVTPW